MAVDQLLFERSQRSGTAFLRFYLWRPACVSLGRNQPARGRYDGSGVRPGTDVVRRLTGGLAVHHDHELTYSVCCPVGALGSPRESYTAINRALVLGLRQLDVPARLAGAAGPRRPSDPGGVCFGAPAPGEVMAEGRKLVGSAQRCERRTILQHGSVLLGGNQRRARARDVRLSTAPGGVARDPAGRSVTLDELLPAPLPIPVLVAALIRGFEANVGTGLAPALLTVAERNELQDLEDRYRSADWTWRR